MKYILIIFCSFFLFSCDDNQSVDEDAFEYTDDVPEVVQESFRKKYPNENSPEWGKDKNGWYEAHFKKEGEKYRADFRPTGEWIETENDIKAKNLPKVIRDIIDEQFKDYKLVEVEHVTHYQKGMFYDVEFKKDGKKIDVEFNEDGKAIGMEEKE